CEATPARLPPTTLPVAYLFLVRCSMRAIIATDFESHLRKVVWITENPGGVSAGICERKPDPHATYHVDGTYHCKIRSKGLDFTAFQERKCPLAEIQTEQPLLVTGAFYADDTMRRLPLL